MPHSTLSSSTLMRPFVVLALPGMYLLYKYNQYRQQQMETARRRVTERELLQLNHKIDKLLNKLEENEPELATSQEDECVICVNAKATMQTSPCGHRVVCRRCFVKTIQMAVSQRLLPLRCVICRAKILRLRHTGGSTARLVSSKSWQISGPVSSGPSTNARWGMAGSISCYSVGARSVPNSASLYSMTSGSSSLSGVSSVSSASDSSMAGARVCSGGVKVCGGAKCSGACLGAVPKVPRLPRQPASAALRRSQHHSMKIRLQDYQVQNYAGDEPASGVGRLPPIKEFQRDYREGKRDARANHATSTNAIASASTRIRCAQKIVTQLETSPSKKPHHFFRTPLKTLNNNDSSIAKVKSKLQDDDNNDVKIGNKKEISKQLNKREDKKKIDEGNNGKKQEEKVKKDDSENKKNELAEKKKEEKLKLKAEKEAKKEAKKVEKEKERQAKLLAKEEKKRAKKESKQAQLNEKDKK